MIDTTRHHCSLVHCMTLILVENVHTRSATSRAYVCVFFCFTLYLKFLADKRHYLPEKTVKKYMLQLCKSVDHCHRYVQVEMAASKVTALSLF